MIHWIHENRGWICYLAGLGTIIVPGVLLTAWVVRDHIRQQDADRKRSLNNLDDIDLPPPSACA